MFWLSDLQNEAAIETTLAHGSFDTNQDLLHNDN